MIRPNKLALTAFLLVSSYFLVACHSPALSQPPTDTTTNATASSEIAPTQAPSSSLETTALPKIISDHEQNGIQYPVFTANEIGTALNSLIEQAIPTISARYPNQSFQYTLSLLNDSYLSLIFDANITDGAYPHHAMFTLNFNLTTLAPLKLSDVVTLNEDFHTKLEQQVAATLADLALPSEALPFTILKERVTQLATSSSTDTQFYLTDNQLILLFDIPHVLGDTLKIQIPYSD